MDWYSINTLQSVGGAAACVTIVTAILKAIFGVSGRKVQIVALCLSLVIAAAVGSFGTFAGILLILINACVICAAAIGLNEGLNYGK